MSESTKNSKNTTNIILIVLIVLLLLGGAFYLVSANNSAPEETVPPAETLIPEIVPSITIGAVETGVSVTVSAQGFPADTELTAKMDKEDTDASSGIEVGKTTTDETGVMTATYTIPAELAEESRITIRLEGGAGYWAFNIFDN